MSSTEVRRGLKITGLRSPLAGPFDLELSPGSVLAISGASGAGKSLFLRMVADLDPHEGDVVLDGVACSSLAADIWRRRAPYVAAESGWWAQSVPEHFLAADMERARALALRLGVGDGPFEGQVERLSTGEKQRLALVRALLLDAPLMLLDEPTGPLDPVSVEKVEAVLAERVAAGAILLMVTHDPAQGVRMKALRRRMVAGRLESDG